jgi:NAD(P)-dependent dehydrogenase (short-subunit alcohol dehydrogenase family)
VTTILAPSQLDGRTVLITGGTSGIGLAAAIQAKAAGAVVIIVGSNRERTAQIAADHGFAGWRAADVSQPEEIQAAFADLPHIDHLVLLAGSFIVGKVLEADIAYLRRSFDERIWAAVYIMRTLGDRLAADASVIFVSGAATERPNAHGTAIIAAAAAAMEALARGLALEQAPRRFNTLSPGPIDTPILNKALGDGREAFVDHLASTLPLQRLGTAEEAGAAVVFLMTNGWMNGATLNIDGGMRLV